MSVKIQIEGQVQLRAWRDKKSGWWVGSCEALQLTASGETWAELQEDFNGALQDLFEYLLEKGKLRDYLKQRGWAMHAPVRKLKGITPRFDIPWSAKKQGRPRDLVLA